MPKNVFDAKTYLYNFMVVTVHFFCHNQRAAIGTGTQPYPVRSTGFVCAAINNTQHKIPCFTLYIVQVDRYLDEVL